MPPPMPTPGLPGAPPSAGAAGPASNPSPMAGNAAHGVEKLKLSLKGLQESLSALPMGSPIHTAVLKALTDIGKELEKHGGQQGDPGAAIQQLLEMARNAKQAGGPTPQLPGAGGAPPPPMGAGPPAPPPPGA
jgi:hypothetical protein